MPQLEKCPILTCPWQVIVGARPCHRECQWEWKRPQPELPWLRHVTTEISNNAALARAMSNWAGRNSGRCMLTHRRCYTPDWCSLVTRLVTNVRISQTIKAGTMQHTLQPSSNAAYRSGDAAHWGRDTTSCNSRERREEWMTPFWFDGAWAQADWGCNSTHRP